MSSEPSPSDDFEALNDNILALDHVDPAVSPFSALPAPFDGDAKYKLTLLLTGIVFAAPKPMFIHGANPGLIFPLPSICNIRFLLKLPSSDGSEEYPKVPIFIR